MNDVKLIGRLTAEPTLKATPSGKSVLNFTIAVQRKFKDASGKPITDYIDCVSWENTATFIAKWFSKGVRIAVSGELQTRLYKDNDGKTHKIYEVLVEEVEFADGKQQANNTSGNTSVNNTTFNTDADDFIPLSSDDADLPFN